MLWSVDLFQFDQPTLNLFARDFYILAETIEERRAYKDLVTEVLKLLKSNHSLAEEDADEVLQFETELANVGHSFVDARAAGRINHCR